MIYKERYCTDEQLRHIKDLGLVMFDCSPDFRLTQQMAIDMFDEKGVYIEIGVYGIQKPKFGYTIAINDTFLGEDEKFFDDFYNIFDDPKTDDTEGIDQLSERKMDKKSEQEMKDLRLVVVEELRPVREKYLQLQGDKAYLEQIYKQGAEKACLASRKILRKVYKKIGFIER